MAAEVLDRDGPPEGAEMQRYLVLCGGSEEERASAEVLSSDKDGRAIAAVGLADCQGRGFASDGVVRCVRGGFQSKPYRRLLAWREEFHRWLSVARFEGLTGLSAFRWAHYEMVVRQGKPKPRVPVWRPDRGWALERRA